MCLLVFSYRKMWLNFGLTILTAVTIIGAEDPVMTPNSTFVSINEVLKLTCKHTSANSVDWWIKPNESSEFTNILTTGFASTVCTHIPMTVPSEMLSCECIEMTAFTCRLKPMTQANYGDKWKCSISDSKNQAIFSNEITVTERVSVKYVTLTPELPQIYVLPNVEISYMRCESSVGRPEPSITWYLDNRTPSDFSDDVNLTGYSSGLSVSDVTTSSLKLTPTSNHNDARIYCNVSNEYGQIMSNRTLKINVLIYPTKPTIMHNTVLLPSSISAIQNSTMTLECHSSGNPEPNISWTLFNGSTISSSVVPFNLATSKTQEQIVCRATSRLDPTNGSRVTVENTTATTVHILYPPSSPSCQIGSVTIQSNVIRAVVNKPFTMTCTSRSNPPPSRYIWALPYGSKQTGAQLLIQRMQPSDDNRYTLEVVNEMNATFERDVVYGNFTESYTFELLYPVTNLSIYHRGQSDQHIDSPTISVIGGREVSFRCNAFSNPVPRYVWKLSGAIVANGSYWKTTFVNNTSIVCIATNTIEPTGNETMGTFSSSNVSIDVLYAPETPKLTFQTCATYFQTNHLKVIRGHSVSGKCTSKSEPGSKFHWTPINTGNGDGFLITNVSRYHIGNYTCIANNEMNTTFGGNIIGTNQSSFYLDVLAPAEALFIGNLTVLLNTTLSVTCPYTPGNPAETRFTWFHANTSSIGSHQNLSLSNVQLTDEGYYKCRVNNTMDPTGCSTQDAYNELPFYVDVQYPAKISRFYADGSNFASSVTINESQTVMLLCEADSDPLAKLAIVNITKSDERLLVEAHNNTISAHVVNARCEFDMGVYQCKGKNKYNSIQQVREIEIRITCSPRSSPFAPPIATVYRRRNTSAILSFTIVAYPPPNNVSAYVWRKQVDGEWVPLHNNSRFLIRLSNDSLQTNLSISALQMDDFTNYSVRVNNNFGSTEQTFVIRANEQSSMPQHIVVVDSMVTESSVTVQWTPGFNGGEDQWFVIAYKKAADETWTYINVSSTVTQLRIGELVAGTKYEVKMYAENIIGKSDDTSVFSVTTKSVISEQKGSVSKAVGGTVGGLSVIFIIVAVIIVWRRRKTDRKDPFSHQILPKRSAKKKPENTTYENIGMVTPNPNIYNMTSSLTEDLKQPTKHVHAANKLAQNNQNSLNGAFEHTDRMDVTKNPDPHRKKFIGDIRRSGKADVEAIDQPRGQNSFALEQDTIYDNLVKKQTQFRSRHIAIHTLRESVVKSKDDSTEVFTEFIALNVASDSISYSTDSALKSANTSKNRYKNMYPYDKNRVKLPVVGNDIDSDFINASFIDGYLSPKKYIAAQGPLASTRADFWSMIWEQNVGVIAMVTNLVEESKRKCFQYWPISSENDCQYSDYTIRLLSEETYANFVVRTLHCSKSGSIKVQTVNHLHFTAWPDKDVPDTALSLMQFWRKVRNVEKPDGAPWIVHCSAGVGRTGTFIALDYLYDQGITEKQINVFDAVLLLRQQRINMVQTKNQYLYLHEVLCEALCTVGEVFENTAFIDTPRTSDSLNQEYQHICKSHIPDREEGGTDGEYALVLDGEKPDNLNKNADLCVVPDDRYRPVLNVTLNTLGHNDYINAVYISTFGEKDRLILTQSALVSSAIDFVRLLHDHVIRTVVTFADEVEPYMPGSSESCLIGPFTATTKSDTQKQVYKESVVQFKYIAEYEGFEVRIIRFTKWSNTLDVCNIKDLMSLLISVQESACRRPVVLQCRDGYSQSGLFAVLWCLVERCQRDGEVAVAETVKMIRTRRKQVITNEAQYRFCHQFMKEYIEGSLVYANT